MCHRKRDIALGRVDAEARPRRHNDYQAGLVAVFGGRRALDDFHGLDGIYGNLVRENLALLIRDRLAID